MAKTHKCKDGDVLSNVTPYVMETSRGTKYRLQGTSKKTGKSRSLIVSEAVAKKFGVPKKAKVKKAPVSKPKAEKKAPATKAKAKKAPVAKGKKAKVTEVPKKKVQKIKIQEKTPFRDVHVVTSLKGDKASVEVMYDRKEADTEFFIRAGRYLNKGNKDIVNKKGLVVVYGKTRLWGNKALQRFNFK